MNFNSELELNKYLGKCKEIGFGSQGVVYRDKNNVLKIFHQYFDKCEDDYVWKKEDILKFNGFQNKTYIFPVDILSVENEIIGEISKYVKGHNLDKINPLTINIDTFIEAVSNCIIDIKKISDKHIVSYDIAYNTLYNGKDIHIIDTTEYTIMNLPKTEIFKMNQNNFNMTIMYFLIDNYFDEFIENNKLLKEMYISKNIDILEFLKLYKLKLSEHTGYEIQQIKEASSCLNKRKRNPKYIRTIY